MSHPTDLRVEHLDDAVLGLGERRPRLSWRLPAGAATDQGLVPMIFFMPPHGAIAGPPLVVSSVTQPSRAPIKV